MRTSAPRRRHAGAEKTLQAHILDRITAGGYVDTFRHFHPDTVKYSWWTYRFKARERNIGWRIDYFFVTADLIEQGRVTEAFIDNDIPGSGHCPIGLVLQV